MLQKILPIYTNTIPREHREQGMEILQTLLSGKIISISSDGFIYFPGVESFLSVEDFLRLIMIKNHKIGENGIILREIVQHIDPKFIRNQKAKDLIGAGNIYSSLQNTWLRYVCVHIIFLSIIYYYNYYGNIIIIHLRLL